MSLPVPFTETEIFFPSSASGAPLLQTPIELQGITYQTPPPKITPENYEKILYYIKIRYTILFRQITNHPLPWTLREHIQFVEQANLLELESKELYSYSYRKGVGHRWLADHARILKERKLKVGQGIRELVDLLTLVPGDSSTTYFKRLTDSRLAKLDCGHEKSNEEMRRILVSCKVVEVEAVEEKGDGVGSDDGWYDETGDQGSLCEGSQHDEDRDDDSSFDSYRSR